MKMRTKPSLLMGKAIAYAGGLLVAACLASCARTDIPAGKYSGPDEFTKSFSLLLSDGATRSGDPASGESSINEASVFIYQKNCTTGMESLYQTVHTESGKIDADLLFNSEIEFVYRFEAYVNMGIQDKAPSQVLFSSESEAGFQMHGELEGIDQHSASNAVLLLKRYVGRVIIESIRLDWKQAGNSSQDFAVRRIWLANTAEAHGGAPAYNTGGLLSRSDMDNLLVSEMNEKISDGGTCSKNIYLYGYGTEGTAVVLECEWAGRTMYYHIDCDLSPNRSTSMSLSIHQTGSHEPLGAVTDDALTRTGTFAVSEWDEDKASISFGEEMHQGTTELPAETPLILRTNGRLYTSAEWMEMDIDDKEAVGVALSDGIHSLVVHPLKCGASWAETADGKDISSFEGISIASSDAEAVSDFNGKANTDAMLAAVTAGVLSESSAAQKARNTIFANGEEGYLPAAGELAMIRRNWGKAAGVKECMSAIGGDTEVRFPLSSTLKTRDACWTYNTSFLELSTCSLGSFQQMHVVCIFHLG